MKTLFLAPLAAAALVYAAGRFTIQRGLLSSSASKDLILAGSINLGASWLSLAVIALARSRWREYAPQLALAGVALRVLPVAGALLALTSLGQWNIVSLGWSILVFYLVLLVVDTICTVKIIQDLYANSEAQAQ